MVREGNMTENENFVGTFTYGKCPSLVCRRSLLYLNYFLMEIHLFSVESPTNLSSPTYCARDTPDLGIDRRVR